MLWTCLCTIKTPDTFTMLNVVLFEPEIAPNTGNIIRLAANAGFHLHLIEPLGFELDEKRLRRAGLDYAEYAELSVHRTFEEYTRLKSIPSTTNRLIACSTKGTTSHSSIHYQPGDSLIFGPESRGLPDRILNAKLVETVVTIPMKAQSRSLNLSNAVAIVVYEAWRQLDFK